VQSASRASPVTHRAVIRIAEIVTKDVLLNHETLKP
jgi:hypothetical protein